MNIGAPIIVVTIPTGKMLGAIIILAIQSAVISMIAPKIAASGIND